MINHILKFLKMNAKPCCTLVDFNLSLTLALACNAEAFIIFLFWGLFSFLINLKNETTILKITSYFLMKQKIKSCFINKQLKMLSNVKSNVKFPHDILV